MRGETEHRSMIWTIACSLSGLFLLGATTWAYDTNNMIGLIKDKTATLELKVAEKDATIEAELRYVKATLERIEKKIDKQSND